MLSLYGYTGNTSITTNVGALRNYGWEFDISSLNISSDKFQWRTSLNLTFEKNRITKLTQESFINGTKRWEVGSSLYDFFWLNGQELILKPEWALGGMIRKTHKEM